MRDLKRPASQLFGASHDNLVIIVSFKFCKPLTFGLFQSSPAHLVKISGEIGGNIENTHVDCVFATSAFLRKSHPRFGNVVDLATFTFSFPKSNQFLF
jgi:hypothetical protein